MLGRCFEIVLRSAVVIAISAIMLVPTGHCLCSEHEDSSTSEQHEPGCPKVRKLDRSGEPVNYKPDAAIVLISVTLEEELTGWPNSTRVSGWA